MFTAFVIPLIGTDAVLGDDNLLLENRSHHALSGILATEPVESLLGKEPKLLTDAGGNVSAQFVPELNCDRWGRYYLNVADPILPNQAVELTATASGEAGSDGVEVVREEGVLLVRVRGKELLRYRSGFLASPDSQHPEFGRSGFLHPVRTPKGVIVTDDFPPEHLHQHGVMFAWTTTTFKDRELDFWNSAKKEGRVEHRKVLRIFSGPIVGGFDVELAHVDLASGQPSDVLREIWSVRAYATAAPFIFEIESTQQTASDEELLIRKYHYGGMAVRGKRNWYRDENAGLLTSEGKNRLEGNHTRPRWVDIYGPADETGVAGMTVMGSPTNFRSPQPVRLHPSVPYFCFCPQVESGFKIEPQSTYRSRFLMVPHDGSIDRERTEAIWNNFAHPLTVKKD